jgi:3-oxoadipate enol-lactonase
MAWEATWRETQRADGAKIPFATVGDGPSLLMVPGLACSSRIFGSLPRSLARRGWRAIVYDPPGMGLASADAPPWRLDRAVEDLAAILRADGLSRVHLLGTSFGGKIALAFARWQPASVVRVFLYGTACVSTHRARAVHRMLRAIFAAKDPLATIDLLRPLLFGRTFLAARPRVVEDMLRAYAPSATELRTTLAQIDALRTTDFSRELSAIPCPVVCHAGLEDTLVEAIEVEATAASLPHGEFRAVPAAGHTMLLENPDAALAALVPT